MADRWHEMPALTSWNPLAAEYRELRTSLSPAECVDRLQAEIVNPYDLSNALTEPAGSIKGVVAPDSFTFTRYTWRMKNTGRPEASGDLVREPGGTLIKLRIGPPLLLQGFALIGGPLVLIAIIASVLTGAIWASVPGKTAASAPTPAWGLLIMGVIAFIIFPYFLKRMSASEGPWLLDFIMRTLDARPADAPAGTVAKSRLNKLPRRRR